MKTTTQQEVCIITRSYEEHYQCILAFITRRITHRHQAEDLVQDVFVRLLEYKSMLRPETVKYFLYTIARNIVTDYLRRYYKKQEVDSYMYNITATSSNETEEVVITNSLLSLEQGKIATLPPQRKLVYSLSRFDGKNVMEIASELSLSKRTVENHLLLGRREVRAFFKNCV